VTTLRVKLDENLSERQAQRLREQGIDATTVHVQGLSASSDAHLADVCRTEDRILITLDKGLADVLRFPPADHRGLVLIRMPDPQTAASLDRALDMFCAAAAGNSPVGRLWIIDASRIREFSQEAQ
jgi:predicted nuclease of predicted toxin-antitoxin system